MSKTRKSFNQWIFESRSENIIQFWRSPMPKIFSCEIRKKSKETRKVHVSWLERIIRDILTHGWLLYSAKFERFTNIWNIWENRWRCTTSWSRPDRDSRKATKEISLVGLCVWKALDASRLCNKGKGILSYSGYGIQMHIDNARSKDLYHICVYTWPIRCCVHIRFGKGGMSTYWICASWAERDKDTNRSFISEDSAWGKLESMYFNISFHLDIIVR